MPAILRERHATVASRLPPDMLPLALICALLGLRMLYLFTLGVDSDEPQNLHVVYGWQKGDIPYLGQFDNHTPLFHWMFLPFAALVGQSANVVVLARLALVPLSFGAIFLLYLLCRRLYGRRTALWTVAASLALADWSLKSIEFRPDVLWMFLWFAALLALVRPEKRPSPLLFFLAGMLLGASATASVKTAFLLPALAVGWAAAWLLFRDFRACHPGRMILLCAIAGGGGVLIIPAIVAGYFAAHGALRDMVFCIYSINKGSFSGPWIWVFLGGMPATLIAARTLVRENGMRPAYRTAVALSAITYVLAIIGLAPYESLAKQTFLPVYPLLIAGACHAILSSHPWRDWQVCAVGGGVCAGLAIAMLCASPPFRDGTAPQRLLLQAVLEHTKPGDYVMDLKGETVFRKRPVYLSYVGLTTRAMEEGRLEAPATSKLRDTATAIVTGRTTGFPTEMRVFLRQNYVNTTERQLRVAGKVLKPSLEGGHWIERAKVAIPGEYVLIENGQIISESYIAKTGKEQIFDLPAPAKDCFIFWKEAWESGLRPTRK